MGDKDVENKPAACGFFSIFHRPCALLVTSSRTWAQRRENFTPSCLAKCQVVHNSQVL